MSVFNKMLDRSEMAFEPFVTFISIDKLSILWQLLLESGDRFNHAATLCFNLAVVVIPMRSMRPSLLAVGVVLVACPLHADQR